MFGKIRFTLLIGILMSGATLKAQQAKPPINSDPFKNTYLNPVLSGDYPDPSIMRDGKDYYLTHSAFDYVPGLTVWHSTDLINWEPISYALNAYLGSVWAPDIVKYNNKFYIYFTIANKGNFVVYAPSAKGPWSKPIDLHVGWIDPSHMADESGQRWLFLSGGHRIKLAADGLSTQGELQSVYGGWKYPAEWETEGFALEGPKLKKIGGYYYWLNAEGGTSGPPTSHMVVVARSKSLNGPWENAPNNPLIHTYNRTEKWWSKGHGSLIDAPDGRWWIVYHAYEKDFLTLGRQMLMEPVEITKDGWLKAPTGAKVDQPLMKPVEVSRKIERLGKLNEFRVGLDWRFYKKYDSSRISYPATHTKKLQAHGQTPQDSAPLLFVAGAHDYEFSVKVQKDSGAVAGLVMFYNADFYVGTGFDSHQRLGWRKAAIKARNEHRGKNLLWLKLRNDKNIVTGYYSYNGKDWIKEGWARDVSGYHHNTLYDFISLLPGIFTYGTGEATFSDFQYKQFN